MSHLMQRRDFLKLAAACGLLAQGGVALAAGEQEGGSQQREGFVHKGKLRSVAWLHHDTSGGRKPTAPRGFAERVNLSRQLSCFG